MVLPTREQRLIFIVALLVFTVTALFFWRRISGPSDSARVEPGQAAWRQEGLVVTSLGEQPGGLRSGDLVVAVDGRALADWAGSIFRPDEPSPAWRMGQTVAYQVLREGQLQEVQVTLGQYPWIEVIRRYWGVMLFVLVSQLVTTFVFIRQPADRAAQLLFLWSWTLSHTYVWAFGLQVSDLVTATGFWLYSAATPGLWILFWCVSLHFALVFPRRHILIEKYPWTVPSLYIFAYLVFGAYLLAMLPGAANTLEWLGIWSRGGYLIAAVYLFLMVAVIAQSYRSSQDPVVRMKVRWVVFAAFLSGGGGLVWWVLPPLILGRPLISANLLGLLLLPFPLSLAIAILRHQLFDIDVIIRRTLVYSSLTAVLALVYFLSVVLLQSMFRALTGETSQAAVVLSTLAIAALFNPLRGRLQQGIDRRFNRRPYDAGQILAAFSTSLRDEVDLDQLSEHLLSVVQETIQPESVTLWIIGPDSRPTDESS